jgi:hypothetical protein
MVGAVPAEALNAKDSRETAKVQPLSVDVVMFLMIEMHLDGEAEK